MSLFFLPDDTNAEEIQSLDIDSVIINNYSLDWLSHSNNTFGITVNHPPYLQQIENPASDFNGCNKGESIFLSSVSSPFTIHIFKEFTNDTLDQYIQNKISCYGKSFQEFKLIEDDKNSSISERSAYKLLYTYNNQSDFHKIVEIGSKIEDRIYFLLFDVVSEYEEYDYNFGHYMLDMQRVIDSFVIIESYDPLDGINGTENNRGTNTNKQGQYFSKNFTKYIMNTHVQSFPLKYNITGGKIITIIPDLSTHSNLDILISTDSGGILIIELPRSLIDDKDENREDEEYGVFLYPAMQRDDPGGDFAIVDEIKNNHRSRTLAIEFRNDTQYISIMGEAIPGVFGLSRYAPEVILENRINNPSPDLPVEIIANVTDIFGKIDNVILKYSVDYDGEDIEREIPMELIWGNLTDGSYMAIIPAIVGYNTTVEYTVNVIDDLGYSSGIVNGHFITESHDEEGPKIEIIRPQINQFLNKSSSVLNALVVDYGSGVKNVSLDYYDAKGDLKYFTDEMKLIEGNKWNGLYRFTLPPSNSNVNYNYSIFAYDNSGNEVNSARQSSADPKNKETTRITIDMIMDVDPFNLTLQNGISINGRFPIQNYPLQNNPSGLFTSSQSSDYIEIINTKSKSEPINHFEIPITIKPGRNALSLLQFSSNTSSTSSIDLIGEPTRFPFDSYYANLIVATPFKNTVIRSFSPSFSSETNISWIPTIHKTLIGTQDIGISNGNSTSNTAGDTRHYFFPSSSDIIPNNHTFFQFRIDLQRSNTIAIVIIPMIGIFYLLGAIFIFENSSDNIGNRLALTLGIFALIFTLPEIISSMKPATSALTIADSLLGIIIIASIAFTVTSVMSSSPSIHKLFPKHHTWIDGIVFFIVSGLVVTYSANFPSDVMIWLVPVIIFGLGYGLIVRALGIKINKPFLNILHRQTKGNT